MALAGHVCRFLEPSEYPEWDEKWKDIKLPMIPKTFKIDAIHDKKMELSIPTQTQLLQAKAVAGKKKNLPIIFLMSIRLSLIILIQKK